MKTLASLKIYTVEVKADGEWSEINIPDGGNWFYLRAEAEAAMDAHRAKYPFRLTMRVMIVR